jgi:membrane protein YdbS with pleckstrin-like domain
MSDGALPPSNDAVDGPAWRALPHAARWVYRLDAGIGAVFTAGLLIAIAVGLGFAMEGPRPYGWYAAGFTAYVLLGLWRGHLRWRHTSWTLDDTGFRIRRGWVWQSESLVPRARVQHLDIHRGPIERRFELATLTVYTAGTSNSAVSLASLGDADAVALRDALLPERGRDDDAL